MTTEPAETNSPTSSPGRPAPRGRSRPQGGPPPALLAAVSLALLIGALATSAALGGVFPSPFASPTAIAEYFARESDAVRATAVFLFGSAVRWRCSPRRPALGCARWGSPRPG